MKNENNKKKYVIGDAMIVITVFIAYAIPYHLSFPSV